MSGKINRNIEDDGRVIADMSGLGPSRPVEADRSGSQNAGPEPPPFSWKERFHYMGAALGAALLIALAFIAGLGIVIWLITLYGMK